jgi:hypothetical protein
MKIGHVIRACGQTDGYETMNLNSAFQNALKIVALDQWRSLVFLSDDENR